jgi:hypothetical protein
MSCSDDGCGAPETTSKPIVFRLPQTHIPIPIRESAMGVGI